MSLIGKVLALADGQTAPPVPMAESGIWSLRGSPAAGSMDEAFLRAYGMNGTTFSNGALLASATAGPEWVMFRDQPASGGASRYTTSDAGSDQRQQVTQHAALALLQRPNKYWSRFRLFEISQLYQDLTGKCHWVITKRMGIPTGIWPVRPDRMQPVPDPDKYLLGWLYTAPGGRETVALDPDEVIYNPLPDPVDSYGGTGPIQSVLTEIDAIRYAQIYNKTFFANSARPDGVLSVDHRVEDDEWDESTLRWQESHRGPGRAHRVAVLEGVTWVPTSTSPKDMDFANLLTSGGDRIREALGMHKIMTGLVDDVNRANAQTGEEIFAAWKVAPRLRRWKDVINFQYLPMFGPTAAGNTFDFLYPMPVNREADSLELTAKCNAWAQLVANGADPDDAAKVVGLPKMRMITKPPPGGLPVGTPGAGMATPAAIPGESGQGGDAFNSGRFRQFDPFDAYEQQAAAWNRLSGAGR